MTWTQDDGSPFGSPYPDPTSGLDLDPYLGRDVLAATPSGVAELPDQPLLALCELLRDPRFGPTFARALTATDPGFRLLLPRDPAPVVARGTDALVHVFRSVERADGGGGGGGGGDVDDGEVARVLDFVRHLGADLRKFGVDRPRLERVHTALAATLSHLAGERWTPRLAETLAGADRVLIETMLEGMAAETGPATVGATVVDVLRPCRDITQVRLVTDQMIDYHPGQYLYAHTPYVPAGWRRFSPTVPTNPARRIEFAVRTVPGGEVSGALARGVATGDRWELAQPLGRLEVSRAEPRRDVLMIGGGTGVAPLQALLVDMLRFGDNPRVHLFYGARYPGELYALRALVEIASSAPWLTVQPVAEHETDPWWLVDDDAEPLPGALHRRQTGRLVDVVTGYGSWADRQVLVSGSPEMIRATVRGMVAAGTPRGSIVFDAFY